jgi:carboxymethylenebutenolidase
MLEFARNGVSYNGYLAIPESGSGPAVVVIQEWWGLVPHIKDLADRFAEAGFVALAPDLYGGEIAEEPEVAGKLMMALNIAETEKILSKAVDALVAHPSVSSATVGVVGFCMGGQLALFAATVNPKVSAAVDFYGIHPNVHPDFSKLQGPVLGIFAEHDDYAGAEAVEKLSADLTAAGKSHEFHTYPGTHHAFFNDSRPSVYDAEAAADAWIKLQGFFRSNLR